MLQHRSGWTSSLFKLCRSWLNQLLIVFLKHMFDDSKDLTLLLEDILLPCRRALWTQTTDPSDEIGCLAVLPLAWIKPEGSGSRPQPTNWITGRLIPQPAEFVDINTLILLFKASLIMDCLVSSVNLACKKAKGFRGRGSRGENSNKWFSSQYCRREKKMSFPSLIVHK